MFETEEAKRFFAAWQALRTADEFPHYRTVFQSLPNDLLPQLMIVEQAGDEAYTVRFMGTRAVEFWGQDLTGQDSLAPLSPRVAASSRRNMKKLLSHPCGIVTLGVFSVAGRGEMAIEVVVLPVRNDPGKPARLLGFTQDLAPPFPVDDDRPDTARRRWIDLGHGVPSAKPAQ